MKRLTAFSLTSLILFATASSLPAVMRQDSGPAVSRSDRSAKKTTRKKDNPGSRKEIKNVRHTDPALVK